MPVHNLELGELSLELADDLCLQLWDGCKLFSRIPIFTSVKKGCCRACSRVILSKGLQSKILLRSSKKFSKFDSSVWRMEKKDSRLREEYC